MGTYSMVLCEIDCRCCGTKSAVAITKLLFRHSVPSLQCAKMSDMIYWPFLLKNLPTSNCYILPTFISFQRCIFFKLTLSTNNDLNQSRHISLFEDRVPVNFRRHRSKLLLPPKNNHVWVMTNLSHHSPRHHPPRSPNNRFLPILIGLTDCVI